MSDDIPPYVTFINETVERISREFRGVVDQLATKAELELVAYKVTQEVRARERLERDVERNEGERHTKNRRIWVGIWSVLSGSVTAAIAIVAVIVSLHP